MEQQIHFCTTDDGVRIAYATVGEGPPLVKAANWLSHLEFDWRSPVWRHLLAEFARDHTFIRYDERGNGLSDWNVPDLSFDAWVQDLESVIDATGVDQFPLLGISQGGAVAIAYAVRHPEKVSRLILYGAYARGWATRGSPSEVEQREAQLTLVKLGWGQDNPAFRQLWTTLYAPDATPAQAQSFNDLQRISTSPENAVTLLNVMGNIDVIDLLPQVKVPTLVLHCRDESGVPFEEGRLLASSIPGARFVPLEGRNHLLLEGAPAWGKFVKELRSFLGTDHTSIGQTRLGETEVSGQSKPARRAFVPPDLPERYTVISFLGVGGMGEVYLAEDTKLGRKVALKTLPAEFTHDKERLRRFQMEARAASALNHPNLLTIHEIGSESGAHFIAAEYVDGETLRARMKRERMKIDDALDVAQQTAFALTAAHGAAIVHRDIKPENIMIRHDGIVKVLDFGLAKLLEDHPREMIDQEADTRALVLTDPGRVLGTPAYMSPEQARGLDLDGRTDIWSLGVVLYEMLAGRPPFRGETRSHTVVAILESEPPSLTTFAPDTPPELQRIVRKALSKDRDSRYQTARDLMIDLKALRRDLDIQSEMRRSFAPGLSVDESKVAEADAAPSKAVPGSTEQADRVSDPPPTRDDARPREGSIGYRVGAMIAMLLLAAGTLGVWYYFQRQTNGQAISSIESIAVMPFVNASGNNEVEYLSEGMTESLITSLSQLPKLSVKARSSVFRYQGKDASPQQIGKDLNVQAIINGRLAQRGNELTLHIELVDVKTETAQWSEDYKRSMADLVSLQSEVARDVSQKLRDRLSGPDEQKLAKNYPQNTEAYQLYLKGRFYWNKRTEESYQKAIDYFRQATEKDPTYALAWSGLADTYSFLSGQGIRPPHDVFPLAKSAARRAIEIDNSLSEAHTSLAYVRFYYDWDWSGAEQEYKKAIELNPNYATPHHGYAYLLISSGRSEEAFAEIKKAEEIDPLSLVINTDHGEFYYFARRPDEAIKQLEKALDMDPGFVRAHFLLGRALVQTGRCDQAIAEFQKARTLVPVGVEMLGALAQGYASCGRKAEAQKTLSELLEQSKEHYVSPHWMAAVQAALGNKDEAFTWLDQAFERRFGALVYLKINPIWDPLRSDARFAERVKRIGLNP